MKLKVTMMNNAIKLVTICFFIGTISCVAQVNLNCKDFYDSKNRVFQQICNNNGETKSYYIDSLGRKNEICINPDKTAFVFKDDSLFNDYLIKNMKKPQCEGEGRIILALYIDELGNLKEYRILKNIPGVCDEFDKSIKIFFENIKIWKPALKNNYPVKSIKTISFIF